MNILTNIITYFAKFPARAGVLNNFASSTEKYPGYQALKTAIQNLPSPLLPEIEEMVFSTSEMVLSVKLKNTNGFFLLLEYGAVNTDTENRAGARESNISLAVSVSTLPINSVFTRADKFALLACGAIMTIQLHCY